jgi:adsorption protein B
LPVFSLPRKWYEFIGDGYGDDFAEWCFKEMVVRESLTDVVPGCGVATFYSRFVINKLSALHGGVPFNTNTLTEDYDLSFRLRDMGCRKQIFVRFPITETVRQTNFFSGKLEEKRVPRLIAVHEYFPNNFRAAYRQRARWVLGVAFQGWQQLGWKGNWARKYLFFRDRKSVISPFVSWTAYILLLNILVLLAIKWSGVDFVRFPELAVPDSWVYEVVMINFYLFLNRIAHRMFFVWKLQGINAVFLVIPHMIIGNVINFFAVSRAWKLFIVHLWTGKKIGWDKTAHSFLVGEQAPHKLLGEMLNLSAENIELVLQHQAQTKQAFGAICLNQNLINVDQLADALSEQAHYLRGDLPMSAVREFERELPIEMVLEQRVIPFAFGQTGALHLAVTKLCNEKILQAVKDITSKDVLYFVVPDVQFAQALSYLHDLKINKSTSSDVLSTGFV